MGKPCPPSTRGVAKSASELANSSRKELAIPGMESGRVTVRNTRRGEAPRERAASSRFGSKADSTAAIVMNDTGK
ncbi:MAG: hypothetical protein BWY99_00749 [Synergistetes bacterium ADurb.BinA166]|jgi:hypothetical protein|nr:MAG: hypothetical protein BWY99_00749 [Synergistetes bacterium ADurb.BinA166]